MKATLKRGRPSKISDARVRIIIDQLKLVPIEKIACGHAKISHDTLQRWKEADPELCLEIDNAKSIGSGKYIDKLGDKDPHKILKAADYDTWKDRTESQHDVRVLILKKELLGELTEQELIEYTEKELKKLKEASVNPETEPNQ